MKICEFFKFICLANFITFGFGETITGHIYCDNQFEFFFNGQLIASDPLLFTPHQAVAVSFEYDGVSSKTYAILCQDWASDSGYEYTNTESPQLGDGALIAKFSDGTVTSSTWKSYTVTFGPTDASNLAGCSKTSLDTCVVQDNGTPQNWYSADFDDSSWSVSTEYTSSEAGWGRAPNWSGGQCCTVTSPYTRNDVGCNKDAVSGTDVIVAEDECLDPKNVLQNVGAEFIWGADLKRDNKMLFRFMEAGSSQDFTISPTSPNYTSSPTSLGPTSSPTFPDPASLSPTDLSSFASSDGPTISPTTASPTNLYTLNTVSPTLSPNASTAVTNDSTNGFPNSLTALTILSSAFILFVI
mmetsp:Transcript_34054/g.47195  ORF Transcript_34054/g.47195 Transcript_34054/m.47195 type:complete len:355 (-) Transcript_34054:194-1258(-)|eukprot:CAMPEP_0196575976 /NCGR_PEP_ID=MMETSP1081-20130531/5348_1 /TAXON_ID=36882 /ORGANISM="Pyramimonas amylifera, Strain CCMP720" /LENGTH=354 /DNA_ID=CAMNT_0041894447 /DNA_START=70 /DNA_END=1134 /DNA_ORIENTATION=-